MGKCIMYSIRTRHYKNSKYRIAKPFELHSKLRLRFLPKSTGPEVIKLFSCSTQLSTKFILLINVKMPTIVGISTFISMINTSAERLKARNFFYMQVFYFS